MISTINYPIESPVKLLNQLIVLGLTLLFFSEILSYADIKGMTPLNIKHFGFINLILAGFVLCFDTVNRVDNLNRPIFIWMLVFALMNIIWGIASIGLWGLHPEKGMEQFKANILAITYLFTFMVLVYEPASFKVARKAMVGVILFSVVVNIADFIIADPYEWSEIPGRAAGFYFNSNLSGIVLCFGFLITVDIIWPNFKLAYALFVFLGIVLTQSRGGIAIFTFLLLSTFFRNSYSLKSVLIMGIIGFFAAVGINSYLQGSQKMLLTISNNFKNLTERMEAVLPGNSDFKKPDSRIVVLNHYIKIYKQKPIFGNGMGTAYASRMKAGNKHISSHNQFINMMTDFGIFGALILATFVGALIYAQGQFLIYPETVIFVIIFFLFCFTSHNLFDHSSLLFIYAMIGRFLLLKKDRLKK